MANDDKFVKLANDFTTRKTHHHKIWLAKALLRSCFWHWVGIPLVALGLKVIQFWRAHKDGISYPEPALLWSKGSWAETDVTADDVGS